MTNYLHLKSLHRVFVKTSTCVTRSVALSILPLVFAGVAQATVLPANPVTQLYDWNAVTGISTQSVLTDANAFGMHSLGQSTSVIGLDPIVGPFARASTFSNDVHTSIGAAMSNLSFYWRISTADADERSLVTVHVSMASAINGSYNMTMHPGYTVSGIGGQFNIAAVAGFYDVSGLSAYGVATGRPNPDPGLGEIIRALPNLDASLIDGNGGQANISYNYSKSFDLQVQTNVDNFAYISADAFFESEHAHKLYFDETYSISAFVDPIFVVDSGFNHPYTLEMSEIPVVDAGNGRVPLPGTLPLLIGGFLGMARIFRCRAS